jgi:hypothetical protein
MCRGLMMTEHLVSLGTYYWLQLSQECERDRGEQSEWANDTARIPALRSMVWGVAVLGGWVQYPAVGYWTRR